MTTEMKMTMVDQLINQLQREFGEEKIAPLVKVSQRWLERNLDGTDREWAKAMILEAISFVAEDETYWTFVASRIYLAEVYRHEELQRGHAVYTNFAKHVENLVSEGLYASFLLEKYTKEELNELGNLIVPERDKFFTYIENSNIKQCFVFHKGYIGILF